MAGGLWQPEGESTEQVPPPPPGPRGLLPVHAEDPQRQACGARLLGREVPPRFLPSPRCRPRRAAARRPAVHGSGARRGLPDATPAPATRGPSQRALAAVPAGEARWARGSAHSPSGKAAPISPGGRPPTQCGWPGPVGRPARPPPTTGPRSVVRVRPRRISPPVGAATLALSASRPIKFRFRAGHP